MRHFDLSPLYRSTVGFDKLFSILDSLSNTENTQGYPPYNIERTGENAYRITIAIAGFSGDDLAIETRENVLSVKGARETDEETNENTLYRGIAARSFDRRFQLADHVEVHGAHLENGLLHIDLERKIPEGMKPRKIEIKSASSASAKVIKA